MKNAISFCFLFLSYNSCAPTYSADYTTLSVQTKIVSRGDDVILPCETRMNDSEIYLWNEEHTFSETRIFVVTKTVQKTEAAKEIQKYDNFFVNYSYPISMDLFIASVQLEDEGRYECQFVQGSMTVAEYTVQVKQEKNYADIMCHEEPHCTTSSSDSKSSKFYCTCEVIGAFSNALNIVWNVDDASPTSVTESFFGQNGTFDLRSQANFWPFKDDNNVSCNVEGFTNNNGLDFSTAIYRVSPPVCSLEVFPNDECTSVSLACTCTNAIPDVKRYTFYDQNKALIGYSEDSSVLRNIILRLNEDTFYCRGCNGINYGSHSLAHSSFKCGNISTNYSTTLQTTTNQDPTTNTSIYASTCPVNEILDHIKSTQWIVVCTIESFIILVVFIVLLGKKMGLKNKWNYQKLVSCTDPTDILLLENAESKNEATPRDDPNSRTRGDLTATGDNDVRQNDDSTTNKTID